MASKFNPYQRRKTPIRDLYTAQRRLTLDEDDSTPTRSEFKVVNHDGIEDAPSKFEVCDIATAWKDFVTNSPIVGWLATHLVLHNTRSEVYKVLDRLLDEQTVPEIRAMAGLDQTSKDSHDRYLYPLRETPPLIRHEQGFKKSSNFIFSLNNRWEDFIVGGEDICMCSCIFSALVTAFIGVYHVALYIDPWEPSAFPHFLVGWSTVFALNGVASSLAIWPTYRGMEKFLYAVEWPFKIQPKNPAFRGLWWGVDLLDLPAFWVTWSWIFGVTGIIFLPLCEWLLSVSRPDTPPPQSTDPTLLNVIFPIINRWLLYLCVAFNLAHVHCTLSTLNGDFRDMRNSWERRKDRMEAGEDPFGSPSTSSK